MKVILAMLLFVFGTSVAWSAEAKTKKIEDLTIEELAMTADGGFFIANPPIPSLNLFRAVVYPKNKAPKTTKSSKAKLEKK